MRGRRITTLITALAAAATVALTGSVVGPVASSDASAGRHQWRADLDAASTAIPTAAQPAVQSHAKSLIRARASNTKATAVAAVSSTNCAGCTGDATTLQVVYFDGSGPVLADNVANAVSGCAGCGGSAVSVQVIIARKADQLIVNNGALALNLPACTGCTTTANALQFVLVGGTRRDLTAATKDTIGQLQDVLAGRLATAAKAPKAQARATARAETASIADQLQAVLVKDTGSTTVQRNIDVRVG